jgi:hypothetical protein
MLKQIHIQTRLQWAAEKVHWTTKWREIIFSDEKSSIWVVWTATNIIGMTFGKNLNTIQGELLVGV